jgi:uncharacterized membrane protein YvbJ
MGSNEIRLRKQKLNPGKIAHHRNYAELMRKHRRGLKTKQLLLVAIYIVIVLLLILLSFIAIRIAKNREGKSSRTSIEQKDIFPLPWSDERLPPPDNAAT